MNDYGVSVFHPNLMGEDGLPRREVIKEGLSLDEARAWARQHIEARPRGPMYDVCIIQALPGEGYKIIETPYRFDRSGS